MIRLPPGCTLFPSTAGFRSPHGPIVACRGEALAIGGPRHAVHSIGMAFVGEQRAPAVGLLHSHGLIVACRGYSLAIAVPRHARHNNTMAVVCDRMQPSARAP